VLDLEHDADLAPLVEGCRATSASTSASRSGGCVSSKLALPAGFRSLPAAQRLQLVPREVLGEPAFVRDAVDGLRRAAVGELGRAATSVVELISFSWRTTSTPSRENTTSGSTASTPRARARS
jgi:hypothetical protein